jgi:hypothetical protein
MKTTARFLLGYLSLYAISASAQPPVPAGTIDPSTIPKYVIPLVIPPIMKDTGTANDYEIAVRQFSQQILPGGIWNSINGRNDAFPATPVWSYGPSADPTPVTAPDPGSQFNYPAYTIDTHSHVPVAVQWRNELVQNPDECDFESPAGDPDCAFRPHLLPVDQTLHWANPPMDCRVGPPGTDCAGDDPGGIPESMVAAASRQHPGRLRYQRRFTMMPWAARVTVESPTSPTGRTSPRQRFGITITRSE